jgi:hypothetical protein
MILRQSYYNRFTRKTEKGIKLFVIFHFVSIAYKNGKLKKKSLRRYNVNKKQKIYHAVRTVINIMLMSHSVRTTVTVSRQVPLVEHERLTIQEHEFTWCLVGFVLLGLLFSVWRFVDYCLFLCHCIVCSSLIYGFWLPLWYLLTIVLSVLWFTASDYPFVLSVRLWFPASDYSFGVFKPFLHIYLLLAFINWGKHNTMLYQYYPSGEGQSMTIITKRKTWHLICV